MVHVYPEFFQARPRQRHRRVHTQRETGERSQGAGRAVERRPAAADDAPAERACGGEVLEGGEAARR